jgi:DNA ligase (NAD+)
MTSEEIVKLKKKLLKAKEAYYKGEPIMSDADFDSLEDLLRIQDPDNDYFKIVGAPVLNYGKKIAHAIPMKSLQKANSTEDIIKWLRRCGLSESSNKLNLVGMPKFDGNSCSIEYDKGKLVRISTRGDGTEGQDITETMSLSKDIPKKISYIGKLEVRGELYLPKTYDSESNLRNVVSGLIHRKEITEEMKEIKFVAYWNFPKAIRETQALEELKKYFPNVTPYWHLNTLKELEDWFKEHNEGKRHNYDIDLDGLVIRLNAVEVQNSFENKNEHHNDFDIAWKFDNENAVTKYSHTDFDLSRLGNLIPVANLEPVMVQGRLIKRASLDNMANYVFHSPQKGDEVHIEIANDIIPRIVKVVRQKNVKAPVPSNCPHCKSELKWKENKQGIVVHLRCENKKCPEQEFQRIVYWVKNCEMDDVSEKTLEKLRDQKILTSLGDLYRLKEVRDFLLTIDGFGESKVDNLLHQIEKTKKMTVSQFIDRIGIPMVGEKAVKKLGIWTIEDFVHFNDSEYVIGQKIIEWKKDPSNMSLIEELEAIITLEDKIELKSLNGLKVCATGTAPIKRKELIEILEEKGYQWIDSVGKETDILLTDDVDSDSSKMKKAKKLGIKIMTYKEIL